MSNPNRTIDKTHLSLDTAEERMLIHRDFLAHCHRWSHVCKHLQKSGAYRDAVVLDIGCGREMPLAKLLFVNKMGVKKYTGVDCNRFDIPEMLQSKDWVSVWGETDFCKLDTADVSAADGTPPNTLVCFEVLEHVTPGHARRMLEHAHALMADDGVFFVSTPCYNGSAAGNHINEMSYKALGKMVCDAGFFISGHWGTFASIRDYESQLRVDGHGPLFDSLRAYYDTNVLATIFAPLYPHLSRNVLWRLRKKTEESVQTASFFETQSWEEIPRPWSQHPDYEDMSKPNGGL